MLHPPSPSRSTSTGDPGTRRSCASTADRDPGGWAAGHRDALRAARRRARCGAGPRPGPARPRRRRRRGPRAGRRPDDREGGLRPAAAATPTAIYSSTKWPANQPMCMHHELSYTLEFPGLMLFACLDRADRGGATGAGRRAGRARRAARRPGRAVRARGLAAHPQLQRRDRGVGRGGVRHGRPRPPSSATAGPTGSSSSGRPDGGLRTRQRRSAVVRHPRPDGAAGSTRSRSSTSGRWTADVREYLVDVYGEDGLPFNTRFGNGDPIGADVVALINEVYEAHTVREPWQAGDLLLVDNIRTAHSREAFDGPREVLVGMADPVRLARLLPDAPRMARPMTAAPPFAVISGAQVQQALRGREKPSRGPGRGHLPTARRTATGQPAVLLPALPGPADGADHRAARLDRRGGRASTA